MCITSDELIGFGVATVIMFGSGIGCRKHELAVLRWMVWSIGALIIMQTFEVFKDPDFRTTKETWIWIGLLAYSVALPIIAYHLAWVKDKGGWIEHAP